MAGLGQHVAGGDAPVVALGQAVPVPVVDDAGAAANSPRVDGQEGLAVGVGDGGVQADLRLCGPDLDQLTGADLAGRHRVEVRVEGDQAVLADVPQMPLGNHIRCPGQRPQGHVVTDGAMPDDLAMGAVDLRPPHRHPCGERGVHLLDGGERPARQNMIADDQDLALNPSFPGRAIGGQDVDVEVVVPCESHRFRMQRNRLTRSDVATDNRLGPVVDDRHRHTAEVREPAAMTVEERRQVLTGGEAAERVA